MTTPFTPPPAAESPLTPIAPFMVLIPLTIGREDVDGVGRMGNTDIDDTTDGDMKLGFLVACNEWRFRLRYWIGFVGEERRHAGAWEIEYGFSRSSALPLELELNTAKMGGERNGITEGSTYIWIF